MSAPVPRRPAVPSAVPAGRRLSGPPAAVGQRVAQLRTEAAAAGGAIEAIPRGTRPDGTVTVDVHLIYPAPEKARWWRRRTWKFWAGLGAGVAASLAGCAWAVVVALTAMAHAAEAAFPSALGLLVVLGGIFLILSAKGGGGTWTGSGTWKR